MIPKTKAELVIAALRKIGVASNATLTDVEPQSIEDGVTDLESMLLEWWEAGEGIEVGYSFFKDDEPSDVGDDHCIYPHAVSAVYFNLALRIAPDYQIEPTMKVVTTARYGKERLMRNYSLKRARKAKQHYPNGFPVGSGNRLATMSGHRFFHRSKKDANSTDTTGEGST